MTIILRHILPNIASLLVINFALGVVATVLAETGLSFLGFGGEDPPRRHPGGLCSRRAPGRWPHRRGCSGSPRRRAGAADGVDGTHRRRPARRLRSDVEWRCPPMTISSDPVLTVRDLRVDFGSEAGVVDAVRGLDFDLYPGRTTAIVGESGSGKSVSALAVLGVAPRHRAGHRFGRTAGGPRTDRVVGQGDVRGPGGFGDRDGLPGPDVVVDPGVHRGSADLRGTEPIGPSPPSRPGHARSTCSTWSASVIRSDAPRLFRTSCPAG